MITQTQGFTLAKNAGLPDDKARIAAAIMMAESGGNERALANDADDFSFGLWQINMKGSMGPTRRALYGLKKNEDLYDPETNARVMSAISRQGQNFTPWGAFTNGSYKKYLTSNVELVDFPLPGGVSSKLLDFLPGAVPGIGTSLTALDTITKIGSAVDKTAKWVSNPSNWLRVGYVIGGGILIYAGVQSFILPQATKTASTVMGIVGPGGKVSKLAGAAKNLGGKATT